jgi:hypothetical protein
MKQGRARTLRTRFFSPAGQRFFLTKLRWLAYYLNLTIKPS